MTTVLDTAVPPAGTAEGKGAPRDRRSRRRPSPGTVIILAILIVLIVLPVGYLVYGTFRTDAPALPADWTLANYSFLVSPEFLRLAYNSVVIAVVSSALSFVIALLLAIAVCRLNMPLARLLDRALVIPGYLPPFMVAVAWVILLAPNTGFLNALSARVGLPAFNIYSMEGIIFVMTLCSTPIAYLYLRPAVLALDSSLEEAAWMTGASRLRSMRLIVLGLIRPALLSTAVVLFVTTVGEFAVPAILGPNARIYTLSSTVYELVSEYPADPNRAAVLGLLLVFLSIGGLLLARRLAGNREYTTIGPKAAPIGSGRRTRVGWVAFVLTALFVFFSVVLPLAAIILGSLQPFLSPTFSSGWTLDNYTKLFTYSGAGQAIINTVELGVISAVVGMALSLVIARMIVRRRSRFSQALEGASSATLAIPHIVFGLALLWMWVSLHTLGVYGSKWILIFAYLGLFLPFGVRALVIAFQQFDPVLEEAAHMNGAGKLRVSLRIVAPILAPAVLSGATVITYHAMRELSASLLLYTPGNQVMSVQIWGLYVQGNYVSVLALGLVNIVLVLGVIAVASRFLRGRNAL
ncbi:MAG: binding-protein-dependent transport system inner rane component [Schumannella sp.]|nr:binding-protein-dependent transport system inner rane component [Schumannella sp.]